MRQLLRITATFALALVFSAGMAFGQDANEATVDQSGDDNEATVLQRGTDLNETFLDQENDSEALVFQVSDGAANVLTGFGGNDAFQRNGELEVNQQTTVGAMIRLNQVGGVADLDQYGSYHRIELRQGSGSEASIDQGTWGEGVDEDGNFLGTGPSDGQFAFVDQESGDFADIEQGESGHDNNFLDLNQNNGSNSATVEQVKEDGGSEFKKVRPGPNNNVARLDQYGGSDAEVYQRGVQNRLSGTTGKGSFATQGNGSFLRLKQNGDKNWTALDQKNGPQFARLDQSGGSYAEVNQKNGGGSVANRLSGTAGETSFATQNDSRLELLQNGNNNWTAIDQFTQGNTANITQNGDGNTVTMQQGTP